MTAEIRQLQAAARELFTSRSLMEAGEAILANAQVLMHADAHAFYNFLRANRPDSVVLIEMRLDLLDRCRDADIRKAIADYEPLFVLWNEILQARGHQASDRDGAHEIVQLCEQALERVKFGRTQQPRVCGWLLTVLAEALLHDPHGSRVDSAELALIHLRTCADWLPPLSDFQQAEVYRLLGDAYQQRALGETLANRLSAREAYERALAFLEHDAPRMRARVQARLIGCGPPTDSQEVAWEWLTRQARDALSVRIVAP